MCRICALIPYVLIQLVREAAEDVQSAVSALETLLTHRFMAALMLIADILYHLNQLSLIFQQRDLRNIDVTKHVAGVIRTLEETYINGATVSSPQWQTFRSEVPNLDTLSTKDKYTYRGSPEIPFDRMRRDEALREVKTFRSTSRATRSLPRLTSSTSARSLRQPRSGRARGPASVERASAFC